MTLYNFGRNVRFDPTHLVAPPDKDGVLACLERFRGNRIRAHGGLHSWSEAAVSGDVLLDLRHLNHVRVQVHADGSPSAEIEAGCTIDYALHYLRSHGGYTLPTYGIIGKQTMAGAISTATHGSGRASMSHYVSGVSVAAYDRDSGSARIYEWNGGEALLAARCGLGCTGILLSIRVPVQPDYLIQEETSLFDRIDDILACEDEYPRLQFYLVPWSWCWFAQLRRAVGRDTGAVPSWNAPVLRVFRLVLVDVLFNGAVRLFARLRWWSAVRWVNRRGFAFIARLGKPVTDHSGHLLKMRHDLYRHVEMELFVPERHVVHAAAFVEWVLRWCGGESPKMPESLSGDDFGCDASAEIAALKGTYVHDYLITFRRVLKDDTLISMTSRDNADAWYAVSLITYQDERGPFLRMAKFVAVTMAAAYRARPHWGKICPLDSLELAALYPSLSQFRAHCASVDGNQAFVNDFARKALGF